MVTQQVPDSRGGNMGIFLGGWDDNGVDVRIQMTIRVSHRLLIVEIGHIPHSPDYVLDAQLFTKLDCQAVIRDDLHALEASGGLGDDVLTLLHRVEPALGLIDSDRHDHLVKDCQGSGKNVQMAGGERVKGTRE